MSNNQIATIIDNGWTALGIELGSTRIKSVLIGKDHSPIASGSYEWSNRRENGFWTYSLDDIWEGLQGSYQELVKDVQDRYGCTIKTVGSIGISAMMHGYMAFDEHDNLLVPFRTWRNTTTGQAAAQLTEVFGFNIPQRWSVAHVMQAINDQEGHVDKIRFLTTLAGYVHWKLTGRRVLGIGDASGMFPINSAAKGYDVEMMDRFQRYIVTSTPWQLENILPQVLCAGQEAGALTDEGAKLLDVEGLLKSGIPFCPPEGDAGTGMVATNSVSVRTGNVSAGTSIFAMIVLEKPLSRVYSQVDLVTTPCGDPVAMVHCNNCTSDLDAWVKLFSEFAAATGLQITKPALYDLLYNSALEGAPDCGGVLNYNYFSGEPITDMEEGRPLMVRLPDSVFSLPNLMRSILFSTLGTLKIGLDILVGQEGVRLEKLLGHGGLFKTPGVGQRLMAAAAGVPVAVMETAGEGGAWGIALLAAYAVNHAAGESLEEYLQNYVFKGQAVTQVEPDAVDRKEFEAYMERYRIGLEIERKAVDAL